MMAWVRPALAGALLLAPTIASAQDIPDLKGVWRGTNEAAVLGSGTHHRDNREEGGPRFTRTEFTMDITAQEGRTFAGEMRSATDREPIVGVIGSDGRRFYLADVDGYSIGEIRPNGEMDMCYLRSGPDLKIAACIVFSRQ